MSFFPGSLSAADIGAERLDVLERFHGSEEVEALKDRIAGVQVALRGSRGCRGC